jgi:MYXO-CTERM domain-containing protein
MAVGYTVGVRGQNLVGVRTSDWPFGDANDSLGMTTVTFNTTSGAILDVDLELNGTIGDYSFEETAVPGKFDLQSVLTHEAGHMLGLAHTDAVSSSMYGRYEPGSIEPRTLTADDQAAICTVYPNLAQRLALTGLVTSTPCSPGPDNPDGSCSDPQSSDGCSVSTGERGRTPPGVASTGLLLALGAVAMRRRSRAA